MNRYKFSEKALEKVRKVLKKELPESKAPNFFKKMKEGLKIKNGKLFYESLEIVPQEKIADVVRDLLYKRGSDVPWSRDGGYNIVAQRFLGISRRKFKDILQSQRVKGVSDNLVPTRPKQAGHKVNRKGQLEIDLFHISKKTMPYAIAKSMGGALQVSDSYVLSMVDKLTGLYYGHFLGAKKTQAHVMKAVKEGAKWFADRLGIKEASIRYNRDAGSEFSKNLPGKIIRLGPAVEAVNASVQRILFRMIRSKRGGIGPALKQAMTIKNNTISKIHKKTPNDAANLSDNELKENYNKTRVAEDKVDKYRVFKVGDRVRLITVNRKAMEFYKSYAGKHFSKKQFIIQKVNNRKPVKYFVDGKWRYRDQISWPEPEFDKKGDAIVENRLQSGTEKKTYEKKKYVAPVESIGKKIKERKKRKLSQKAEDNFRPVLEQIGFSVAAIKKLFEDGYNLQRFVKQFKKKMEPAEKKNAIIEKFL